MFKRIYNTFLFVALTIYIYINYLNSKFNYLGFEINNKVDFESIFSILIVTVLPLFFYKATNKISNVTSLFIYLLLYIPTIVTFTFAFKHDNNDIYIIYFVFCISMVVIFLPTQISGYYFKFLPKLKFLSINQLIVLVTILVSIFVFKYYSTMKIVSWGDDMYELREINSLMGTDFFSRYVSGWLVYVLFPFILVYGLLLKKKSYVYIVIVYTIVMYMILASKVVLLMPVLIYLFYISVLRYNYFKLYNKLIIALLFISILLIGTELLFNDNEVLGFLPSLLFLRTLGNAGVLNFWYYDFFKTHNYTYLSHINIVNTITSGYTYGNEGLGKVVGSYYWGPSMNANANFWATDGIASFGISGVFFISVFFCLLLIFIDGITDLKKNKLHVIVLLPFLISLTNTSLFSSILTGGLFLVILLFIFLQEPN